jgi:hypothetical protein
MQSLGKFLRIFLLNLNLLLAHRSRYSEEMDDGQKTPRGHPDYNSYLKKLRVLVFMTDRQTDRRTDRQTFISNSYVVCLRILHRNRIQWCM